MRRILVVAIALFYALGKLAPGAEGPYVVSPAPYYPCCSKSEIFNCSVNEKNCGKTYLEVILTTGTENQDSFALSCGRGAQCDWLYDLAAALNDARERRTYPRHANEEGGVFVPPNSQKIIDCTGTLTPCTDNP